MLLVYCSLTTKRIKSPRVPWSIVYAKSLSEVSHAVNLWERVLTGCFKASSMAKKLQREQHTEIFTVAELNWFSRNSYNLAVKVYARWKPQPTLRILRCCIQVYQAFNLRVLEGYPIIDSLVSRPVSRHGRRGRA